MAGELRKGPSGPVVELSTDSIENESELPGATLTIALDGLVARRVGYVNASSSRVGTSFAGCVLQPAPAGWMTEAEVPEGQIFTFRQWGSGAGGGSGSANRAVGGNSSINGGGGGGGGACNEWTMTRDDVIAALPLLFTAIPLGGAGGALVTTNSNVTVNGNDGAGGALCRVDGVGVIQTAGGGRQGLAGQNSATGDAGSGGGRFGNGISTTVGGQPLDATGATSNSTQYNILGGARSTTRNAGQTTGTNQYAYYGGGGGGSNQVTSDTIPGGRSAYGGGGGGHGGRVAILTLNPIQVSAGGGHDITPGSGGGGGGAAGSGGGGAGGAGPDGNALVGGSGGGGGQAATGTTAATSIAGRGGDGGFPGGGGGGGGGAYSQGASGEIATSGAGGSGGDALLLITISA